ncbi:MAG: ArsA family ATPase, partial [Acidimicrobiales bacterium]|nr:ArsA family ATPase [Acidimicrobiales bacterium]
FVSGKGGVGKTSIAAALAREAARRGKRVLLSDADGRGDLAAAFASRPLTYKPTEVAPGIAAMTMHTEDALAEYLRVFAHVPLARRLGPLARTFEFVATAAPGVREILVVGKFAYEVREEHYDLVIVDAASSGHIVSQLSAPHAIAEVARVGLVNRQTQWMIDLLADPATTGAVLVTLAEEMPVIETSELVQRLAIETEVDVAAVVVNRVLPELFGRAEEDIFASVRAGEGRRALSAAVGSGTASVLDAAEFALTRRRQRAEHLEWLQTELAGRAPTLLVPELFDAAQGATFSEHLGVALGDEVAR